MKLKDVTNVEKFFEAINECTDDVDLIGPGVNIHLKSPIAQMVCASILEDMNNTEELQVVTYNSVDTMRLINSITEV